MLDGFLAAVAVDIKHDMSGAAVNAVADIVKLLQLGQRIFHLQKRAVAVVAGAVEQGFGVGGIRAWLPLLAVLALGALGTGLAFMFQYDVVRAAGPVVSG